MLLRMVRLGLLIAGVGLIAYSGLLATLRTKAEGIYWARITERTAQRGVHHQVVLPDGTAYRRLTGVDVGMWSPDGRGIYYVDDQTLFFQPINGAPRRILAGMLDSNVYRIRFAAGGEWLIIPRLEGTERHLYRMRPDGSALQDITPVLPDGEYLMIDSLMTPYERETMFFIGCAGASPCFFYTMALDGSQLEQVAALPASRLNICSFSPDENWVLLCNEASRVYSLNRRTGEVFTLFESPSTLNFWYSWQDNETVLFFDRYQGVIMRSSPDGQMQAAMFYLGHSQPLFGPPNGWIYYHANSDHGVMIYRVLVAGGEPELIFAAPDAPPQFLHVWHDNDLVVAVYRPDSQQFEIYKVPAEGGETTLLAALPEARFQDGYMTLTPDGKALFLNRFGAADYQVQLDGSGYKPVFADVSTQFYDFSPLVDVPYRPLVTGGAGVGLLILAILPMFSLRKI